MVVVAGHDVIHPVPVGAAQVAREMVTAQHELSEAGPVDREPGATGRGRIRDRLVGLAVGVGGEGRAPNSGAGTPLASQMAFPLTDLGQLPDAHGL